MNSQVNHKALIVYYSFSNQTHRTVHVIEETLEDMGVACTKERLRPSSPLSFPVNSIPRTFWLMLKTFFRWRVRIHPLSPQALNGGFDAIILAGPTWSYNPSGPVLTLIDEYGRRIFPQGTVIPVISCRSYWKAHYNYLKSRISGLGGAVTPPIVLRHPLREPWKTLGVFFTIAGKNPKRLPIIRNKYTHYGHTKEQLEAVRGEIARLWREYV